MQLYTSIGTIHGEQHHDYEVFKGIPYAQPPIGTLRFKHARLMPAWPNDFQATSFGPVPIQPPNSLESFFATQDQHFPQSEDCLTLNIWRPTKPTYQPLPVIVFIYGGSFVNGHSAQALYHPHEIVKRESVIVVTINYRLGALGFLDWSAINSEWDANNGLSDQICALQWVRENIAHFGGDPNHLTLMGQSAGAMSVAALLRMPKVRPWIKNAVMLSGVLHLESPQVAQDKADAFAALKAQHYPKTPWHELDAETILTLMAKHQMQYGPSKGLELLYQPVATDDIEPDYQNIDVPVFLSLTTAEGDIYIKNEQKKLAPRQFQRVLERLGGPIPPLEDIATAQQQRDLITNCHFKAPFRQLYQALSAVTPTWQATFNWSRNDHPDYSSAYHILDMIFWMGRLDILEAHGLKLTERETELRERMIRDLCHFAKHSALDGDRFYE
ncbi:carboxylesterase family protein [Staphylococcus intermedius]|uniref:Carboxylic ester hydrolase n=1 Tax=Staphylococcus intermedius NCTC 11048 TaxID=1141106 RepID=A0A380G473_STAIN|nr:carboxylesterase family protein [Staphylococcus intermedius]PCF64369.1 carboxylesterase [Staphylococcus intermedius]PCF79085.1 carboxylesterase [Staphylococcus intermedius]PCF80058.1 carboxylesterase [Staphylococcus intermedius]PCF89281.1 carboxylesterase [Staphylococcus intermedius]PNZ48677.1 carboxylesterase/lipase family protein [Staphylococcus intermedius NCTC 11048]